MKKTLVSLAIVTACSFAAAEVDLNKVVMEQVVAPCVVPIIEKTETCSKENLYELILTMMLRKEDLKHVDKPPIVDGEWIENWWNSNSDRDTFYSVITKICVEKNST